MEQSDFERHRQVVVSSGEILLEKGRPATGIAWTGYAPRLDYEVRLEANASPATISFCGLMFPVHNSYCTLIVGGWCGSVMGLANIDLGIATWNNNAALRHLRLRRLPAEEPQALAQ